MSTRSFMRHQIYILIYKEEKRQCLNPSSSPHGPSRCRPPLSPGPTVPGPSYSQGLSVSTAVHGGEGTGQELRKELEMWVQKRSWGL